MSLPPRHASPGLHTAFIQARLPEWVYHLAAPHLAMIDRAHDPVQRFKTTHAAVLDAATAELRQALHDSQARRRASGQALAKTLKHFRGITEFAKPLLTEALHKQFGTVPDVNQTMLFHLRAPNQASEQSLFEAALRNFQADEPFDEVALQETSALAPVGSLERHLYDESSHYPFAKVRYHIRDKLPIQPEAFARMCRELDLGKQYQDHLSAVFETPSTCVQVREQMIATSKDNLRAQTYIARLKGDIDASAHATLLAVLDGNPEPMIQARPVACCRLRVLSSLLNDVLVVGALRHTPPVMEGALPTILVPAALARRLDPQAAIIVYIPGDSLSPVKQYPSLNAFATALAIKLRAPDYQRFFAGLMPQDEAARFFRRLKGQLTTYRWNPNPTPPGPRYNPAAFSSGIYEQVWNEDADLRVGVTFIEGEVFGTLYSAHLERLKHNARLLAVPTAQVDHEAWIGRLKHYAEWGLSLLNMAAFFVPGLGSVMLLVSAVQLGYEVYQGVEAWKEGDAEQAWTHLSSVLQNVAFMAAVGAVGRKAPSIVESRFVNGMARIKSPFGKVRLWHPDLGPYESSVELGGVNPDALGQYAVDGKSYIRLEGKAYEKTFDARLKQWRIKHPLDPDAYQPVLHHNHHGAWRYSLERPLEWAAPRLLRRMGAHMQAFSDAQLAQIAEVSGVSDPTLREMHVDHLPPPPLLAETIEQFSVDRQVNELLTALRTGVCQSSLCEFAVPLTLELPNWPQDVVLEVFEGPGLTGKTCRYGWAKALGTGRSTIKISRDEVVAGKLAERVLQALDHDQIRLLLGEASTREGADAVQIFRERLADIAQRRKQSLFESLYNNHLALEPDILRMQRSFTSLSARAARHVLSTASPQELAQLRSPTGRVPLRVAKAISEQLRRSALTRAIVGLYLDNMASAASDKLAVHALERLADWPADRRLEVRALGINGPLLDSIGSESAPVRTYLVKEDEVYRAFDAHGAPLNERPAYGRNLFESLLQVLPYGMRQTLQGEPVHDLQARLARYASEHRDEMSLILKRRRFDARNGLALSPPSGLRGYPASGETAGFADAPLIARVRDVYPNLTDEQAYQFIRGRQLAGETDQQIFHLLNNRHREFEGLRTVLNEWVAVEQGAARRGWPLRQGIADRIVHCWRQGLYRSADAFAQLDVTGADRLPTWAADFSHVRYLQLASDRLIADADALLRQFSAVKQLEVSVHGADMAALAEALPRLNAITVLQLEAGEAFSPALLQAVQRMTWLEKLTLKGPMTQLDVGALANLQFLTISGSSAEWPAGVLQSKVLRVLDVREAAIRELPEAMFSGHESLWRGLQINWAAMEPQAFLKAYDYVHDNPAHLVDEPAMVTQYCQARLASLMVPRDDAFASGVLSTFAEEGLFGRALITRVHALADEYRLLGEQLDTWQQQSTRVDRQFVDQYNRERAANRIRASWRKHVRAWYDPQEPVAGPSWRSRSVEEILDLSVGPLGDLPELGTLAFPQVRGLNLSGARLTVAQVNAFLRHFPELRSLNLSANHLTELPQAFDLAGHLNHLDLASNELTITPSIQARLNRLTDLHTLNLHGNRVASLDVTALTRLETLNLSNTATQAWPQGVLSLPGLRHLDLSHSAVTTIPDAALQGHDELLAGTSLKGCALNPPALAAIGAYAQRTNVEVPLGIDQAQLALGKTGGLPEFFPLEVSDRPDLLLAQPLDPLEGELLTPAAKLQRLDPERGMAEAVAQIEAWQNQGLGALEIEQRLGQWQQQHTRLVRGLNAWIDVRAYREGMVWINAVDRRRAADRILACWRAGLRDPVVGVQPGWTLNLSGLVIGDMPDLGVTFNHVENLTLSATWLSAQGSEGVLRGFMQVRSLMLDHNQLESLPEALTQWPHLTRLDASYNDLRDSPQLLQRFRRLTHLQSLNLRENVLGEFDVTGFAQLHSLDLSGNIVGEWPTGVLDVPALARLNLSNNQIERIPDDALLPVHATLMAGTDISDNLLLDSELLRLREYLERTGQGLGLSLEDIDRTLNGRGFSNGSSTQTAEENGHPDTEAPELQKARWLVGIAADSSKSDAWETLASRSDAQDFFYILSQLQHTSDFTHDRLDLTGRVWEVVQGAHADDGLAQELFSISRALRNRATCGDGRILLFNDLEIKTYEFNALKRIEPDQKGRQLLNLSKSLFRLDKVEEIARTACLRNPRIDPAEIRLAYRVGLARRLVLPRQPHSMLYANLAKITQQDLDTAYNEVLAAQRTPAFVERLIGHTYWVEYLESQYPTAFAELQTRIQARADALEEAHAELDQTYFDELTALEVQTSTERRQLAIQLSQRELDGEQAT